MSNPKHLEILSQGVKVWNNWRERHPEILPDLSEVTLRGQRLVNANFSKTKFGRTDFSESDLTKANFHGAMLTLSEFYNTHLIGAKFSAASLSGTRFYISTLIGTDFTDADLSWAKFKGAILDDAIFRGAGLIQADFREAVFRNTDLSNAWIMKTAFIQNNLNEAKGLETVNHGGPSEISISTLLLSGGYIPESFLRGCGLKDWEIEVAKLYRFDSTPPAIFDITSKISRLRSGQPTQFYSCFISYSNKDQKLAAKLYANLQGRGIRCWFAPEDLKIGDKTRFKIDESIRLHDKLLVILSKDSIESDWVEKEVETAMERERQQKRTILFPIRLDEDVMGVSSGWAADIRRSRNIGDFTKWKNHNAYQKAFDRLLRDLEAEFSSS